MNGSDKFDFTYSAPTENERREIETIKKQYMPTEIKEDKLSRLRSLNAKVKRMPLIVASVIGIIGTLILGFGMTMVLKWGIIVWGSVIGLVGIAIFALAFPLHKFLLNRNKKKYGSEILKLSNELLNK